MDDLVGGVFVLPRWLAPWRVRREAPSFAVERPPRPYVPARSIIAEVWGHYFKSVIQDAELTPTESRRARELFIRVVQEKMMEGRPAKEAFMAGQDRVMPYLRKRGAHLWTSNGVQRCDYCGRPHTTNASQCPGCGVWRKQYR